MIPTVILKNALAHPPKGLHGRTDHKCHHMDGGSKVST